MYDDAHIYVPGEILIVHSPEQFGVGWFPSTIITGFGRTGFGRDEIYPGQVISTHSQCIYIIYIYMYILTVCGQGIGKAIIVDTL